jgi:ABC-2 type transport system permease protein
VPEGDTIHYAARRIRAVLAERVPQQVLTAPVLKVARFTPSYWYVKAYNAIQGITSLHWSNLSEVIGCMAIQLGFAAAIISIALVVSKRKRQQAF